MIAKKSARKRTARSRTKKIPFCPHCASQKVVPIIHGIPTPAEQKAVRGGTAMLVNREEWEGMTKWYCKDCGCDWSGEWRRFRK